MRKQQYEQYINPNDFTNLFIKWQAAGKPTGNDPLYIKIWEGVTNAVKACIGVLQETYQCSYTHYSDKVTDGTIKVMKKLLKLDEAPRNIVNLSYLYVLGVCCGKEARNEDFNELAMSLDAESNGEDTFKDLLYTTDEDGTVGLYY